MNKIMRFMAVLLLSMTILFGMSQTFAAAIGPGKTKTPDVTRPMNVISGFVLNSYGKGLGGATVTFGTKSVTTNPDGSYVIAGLPAQQYNVHLSKAGYFGASSVNYVTYENGRYSRNFVMYGTAKLHGTVFSYYENNRRVAHADITLNDADTITSPNGQFDIQTAPGKYTMKISKAGFKTFTQTVDLQGEFSTKSEVFSIIGDLTVKGVVKDSNGVPIAGSIVSPMFCIQKVATGPDGSYTITAMAPGTYTFKVSKINYEDIEKEITIDVNSNLKQDFVLTKKY